MKFIAQQGATFSLKNFANVNKEPWHVQPTELPNSRQEYEKMGAPWAKRLEVITAQPQPKAAGTATGGHAARGGPRRDQRRGEAAAGRPDPPEPHQGHAVQPRRLYGAATQKIVKAFQTANGLAPDGKVGPKTWKALLGLDPV